MGIAVQPLSSGAELLGAWMRAEGLRGASLAAWTDTASSDTIEFPAVPEGNLHIVASTYGPILPAPTGAGFPTSLSRCFDHGMTDYPLQSLTYTRIVVTMSTTLDSVPYGSDQVGFDRVRLSGEYTFDSSGQWAGSTDGSNIATIAIDGGVAGQSVDIAVLDAGAVPPVGIFTADTLPQPPTTSWDDPVVAPGWASSATVVLDGSGDGLAYVVVKPGRRADAALIEVDGSGGAGVAPSVCYLRLEAFERVSPDLDAGTDPDLDADSGTDPDLDADAEPDAENQAPVANSDSYPADEDTLLSVIAPGVLGNDTDGDDDPLTAVLVENVSNGTLTLNEDGSFTYDPVANFNGIDTFTYMADDGTANSNVATVTINVAADNDPPVANPDSYATDQNTLLSVSAPGVLGNDTDADEDPLTAVLVDDVTDGTLTLNDDGSFSYDPDLDFVGSDSFTYKANDGTADSNVVTVTLTVNDTGPLGPILYVDWQATGAETGRSWTDAITDLSAAMTVAADASGVEEIWIAQGTYTPAGGTRDDSFVLVSNVDIYGGFASGATLRSERDSALYPTILSGDIDGDDPTDVTNNVIHVVRATDVVAHTVIDSLTIRAGYADGSDADGRGAGMLIEGDYFDLQLDNCVFEENVAALEGGGLHAVSNTGTGPSVELVITGSTFAFNTAVESGGGAYLGGAMFFDGLDLSFLTNGSTDGGGLAVAYGNSTVGNTFNIQRTVFASNSASGVGGGLLVDDQYIAFSPPSVLCNRCGFFGNTAADGGGAALLFGGLTTTNTIASGNAATNDGGFLFVAADPYLGAHVRFSSVYGNTAGGLGGGIRLLHNDSGADASLFWHNSSSDADTASQQLSNGSGGTFALIGCVVQGLAETPDVLFNFGADPLLLDPDGFDNVLGTLDDHLDVAPGSPVVDANITSWTTTEDYVGAPRPKNHPASADTGTDPYYDIGAYELQPPPCGNGTVEPGEVCDGSGPDPDCADQGLQGTRDCAEDCQSWIPAAECTGPGPVFVDADNTLGPWDGTTWATAFQTVSEGATAADAAGAELWIAEGTYTATSSGGTVLQMTDGMHVYGGFTAVESLKSERPQPLPLTQLQADLTGDGRTSDDSPHVVVAANQTVLDGLTVAGPFTDSAVVAEADAAMLISGATDVEITDVTFYRNASLNETTDPSQCGGALRIDDGLGGDVDVWLTNVVFQENLGRWGGAFCVRSANGGAVHAELADAVLFGNRAIFQAGAVEALGGAVTMDGTDASLRATDTIFGRNLGYHGGAIMVTSAGGSYELERVAFVDNQAQRGEGSGGAISHAVGGTAHPTVTDAVFFGNLGFVSPAVHCIDCFNARFENVSFVANGDLLSDTGALFFGRNSVSPVVANALFADNYAAGSVAVWNEAGLLFGSPTRIVNATFRNNRGEAAGSGEIFLNEPEQPIFSYPGAASDIDNVVVFDNDTPFFDATGGGSADHSCLPAADSSFPTGTGNQLLSADPFDGAAAVVSQQVFLDATEGAVCIDNGSNDDAAAVGFDAWRTMATVFGTPPPADLGTIDCGRHYDPDAALITNFNVTATDVDWDATNATACHLFGYAATDPDVGPFAYDWLPLDPQGTVPHGLEVGREVTLVCLGDVGEPAVVAGVVPPLPACNDADPSEDHDTLDNPYAITEGSYTALRMCTGDDDYFAIDLAAGAEITVDLSFSHGEGDIDLELIDPSDAPVASSQTLTDGEQVTYTALTGGTYVIRVYLSADSGATPGNDYDMDVNVAFCPEDGYEDNDTAAEAKLISEGFIPSLRICPGDEDYYAIDLNFDQSVAVEVLFADAEGNIDIELLSPLPLLIPLASAGSVTDNESLSAPALEAGLHVLHVTLTADDGVSEGNDYSIQTVVTP